MFRVVMTFSDLIGILGFGLLILLFGIVILVDKFSRDKK